MRKRILSILLCLVLLVGLLPTAAFAADIASGTGWNLSNDGVLHITGAVPSTGFGLTDTQRLQVTSVVTTPGASIASGRDLFNGYQYMTSADLSNLDTSNVTDMDHMFLVCISLTSLNLSGFDTGNVTNMYGMFRGCSSLASLDVSGFDTGNVTDMGNMFEGCSSLTSLDVSGFDTGNVTNMSSMFADCSSLASLDVSGFDTGNVTYMSFMFQGCSSLTSLDVSGFDTGNVTGMRIMFWGCSSLASLDVSGFDTGNVTNMDHMFAGCSRLTSLDVSGFDTGNVYDMRAMFWGCSSLASLDVSGFDTGNVYYMYGMFQGCSSLTSLDVSGFDTGNVTDMRDMFAGCSSLASLDVSGFDTGNVTNMDHMFWGCSSLASLDVSGFDTGNVTYMSFMFQGCSSLASLEISPDILHENADDMIAIRSPWQREGSTDTYSTADELKAITENVTLVVPAYSVLPFTDVKKTDWSYEDIAYVYEKGLMQGTSSTTFSPKVTTSRGMIVTILYRLAGEPAVSGTCPFDDVKSGSYYEKAITWAAANGIVGGYGDGKFGPDDPITREQMAAILYRFAEFMGYDVSAKTNLAGYTDAGSISAYAKDALAWANAKGLVTGTSATTLSPKGSATREQVAAILHRFCENIVK